MEGAGTRPIWTFLIGPYALFLLFLLVVPFANVAMYSLHPYSPTKVFLPELTLDNYTRLFDLYYGRLFVRTLRLGLITILTIPVLGLTSAYFRIRAVFQHQQPGHSDARSSVTPRDWIMNYVVGRSLLEAREVSQVRPVLVLW